MPIRSRDNEYRGLNAHLQSYLLNEPGGWRSFHASHVAHLADLLDEQLPDNYYTRAEKSLQISEHELVAGLEELSSTRPDVTIYTDGQQNAPTSFRAGAVASPVQTFPLVETLIALEEDTLSSVVIYQVMEEATGDFPVTRIELLSTANKPPHAGYHQYLSKRQQTLESGVRVVELDYLHETRSPILRLPDYRKSEPGAYPYWILISDPRPTVAEGVMDVYGFNVDEHLTVVNIPLSANDVLAFDFGAAYNYTLSRTRFYTTRAIDYEQLPERFESYNAEDQARIKTVMARAKYAIGAT